MEKYGSTLGFNVSLRARSNQPDMVRFKNPVSTKLGDPEFAALVVDDRKK